MANNYEFLAVHVTEAPQTEKYILKGLLGLSTSSIVNNDAFTKIEKDNHLKGELFMDKLKEQGIDFGKVIQFCEVTRLPNGNTLIVNCSRRESIGKTMIVEVTSDMKVVRQWKAGKTNIGMISAKPLP